MNKKKNQNTNIEKYKEEIIEKYNDNYTFFSNSDFNTKKNLFLDKYISSEFLIKNIMYFYYHDKEDYLKVKDIKLYVNYIKKSLVYFNIHINDDVINKIFGAETKRGSKSCKKLRDGIVHDFSSNDAYEVVNRFDELDKYLDDFINIVINNGGK